MVLWKQGQLAVGRGSTLPANRLPSNLPRVGGWTKCLQKAKEPPPKSYAAAVTAKADAEQAVAMDVEATLKLPQQPLEQTTAAAGGTAAAAATPGAANATLQGQLTDQGGTSTVTGDSSTSPATLTAAAYTGNLIDIFKLVAQIEPGASAVMEACIAKRTAGAACGGHSGGKPAAATAAAATTAAAAKADEHDSRTPARRHADATTKHGHAKTALASDEALVVKKNAEAAALRQEIMTEAQSAVDAAVAAHADAASRLDAIAAKWLIENTAKLSELREKAAVALDAEKAAALAHAAAGDKAHEPPPPPNVLSDDSDDLCDDDSDHEGMCSATDGDTARRYDISDAPPAIAEFQEPPAFNRQLDEAVTAKLATARRTLEHWVQQAVRIPLSPNSLGLTAAEIKELVGEEVWTTSVPAGVIVADTETLPGGIPGVLFTALLRININAPATQAADGSLVEGIKAMLKKAATGAASTRATSKLVRRRALKKGSQQLLTRRSAAADAISSS